MKKFKTHFERMKEVLRKKKHSSGQDVTLKIETAETQLTKAYNFLDDLPDDVFGDVEIVEDTLPKVKIADSGGIVVHDDLVEEATKVADVNNDGVVDEKDLSIVHKEYSKTKKTKPRKKKESK